MFNKNKFKAVVVAAGKTMSDVAEMLGINEATLYRKIARDGAFTRNEIQQITIFLNIENPIEIFFEKSLA